MSAETNTVETQQEAPPVDILGQEAPAQGQENSVSAEPTREEVDNFLLSLPEDLRAEKSLQSFKDEASLAKSYVELRKQFGKKFDELTGDEIRALTGKFGAPESIDGYEFDEIDMPEGAVDLTDWFKEKAFDLGLPADAANKLRSEFVQYQNQMTEQFQQQIESQQRESIEVLKKEFGSAYDQRVSLANKALKDLGGDEAVQAIQQAGLASEPALVKMLAKVGELISEDSPAGNENKTSTFGVTPDEAAKKIAEKMADPAFKERWRNPMAQGHNEAVAELEALYKLKSGR